jgi:hypothetical protein
LLSERDDRGVGANFQIDNSKGGRAKDQAYFKRSNCRCQSKAPRHCSRNRVVAVRRDLAKTKGAIQGHGIAHYRRNRVSKTTRRSEEHICQKGPQALRRNFDSRDRQISRSANCLGHGRTCLAILPTGFCIWPVTLLRAVRCATPSMKRTRRRSGCPPSLPSQELQFS